MVPEHLMEFFPLGGIVFEEITRMEKRRKIRDKLGLDEDDILVTHTGKMNKDKRTEEILEAFKNTCSPQLHLILIGSLSEEIKTNVEQLIASDRRIRFIGWKSGNELMNYLCASDLYLQLGTQSATMQNAVCCGNAVALYPYLSHTFLLEDKAFYVHSKDDVECLLRRLTLDRSILQEKRKQLYELALRRLDYKVLAARICQ